MWLSIGLFALGAAIIGFFGPRLSVKADQLGGITGMGQTLAGILFLGASTSLPGLIVSFKTALDGSANLAVSNSIGGIAAQTLFIAIADIALRKKTLTHENLLDSSLLQSAVLISLLTLLLLAMLLPEVAFWHIHPVTPIIILFVIIGFRIIKDIQHNPRWQPLLSKEKEDNKRGLPEEEEHKQLDKKSIIGKYLLYLAAVATGGWLISYAGSNFMERDVLSPIVIGATLMAIATSLPELVTAISAVRRGNVALAIGDIVGGNAFDTIMVAIADLAYSKGPIFTAVTPNIHFLTGITILMTGILLIGFIRRQKQGLANIGIESYFLIFTYVAGILVVLFFDHFFVA